MLRRIHLAGPLAKEFGKEPIELDADDLTMLVRGLDCARPGFFNAFRKQENFALALKSDEGVKFLKPEDLSWRFGSASDLYLATEEHGSGAEIAAWAAFEFAAIVGIEYYTLAYVVTYIAVNVAIAYVVGQIAMSLAPKPETSGSSAEERASYLFDGAVNLQGQGHPVPLVYGRFRTGSVVISAEVTSEKAAIAISDGIRLTASSSATGNIFKNDIDGTTLTLDNFIVEGVTKTPGTTHTSTNFTVTIAANGDYTFTSTTAVAFYDVKITYNATSSTTGAKVTADMNVTVTGTWESYGFNPSDGP